MDDKVNTSFRCSPEELKSLKLYCLENDMKLNDFLLQSAFYCLNKNITFKEKK